MLLESESLCLLPNLKTFWSLFLQTSELWWHKNFNLKKVPFQFIYLPTYQIALPTHLHENSRHMSTRTDFLFGGPGLLGTVFALDSLMSRRSDGRGCCALGRQVHALAGGLMSLVFRVRGTGRSKLWMLASRQLVGIGCNYCPASPLTPLSFISTTHRGTGGSSETPHSALAEARQLRRELGVAWGFHPSMSSPPTATSNSWRLGASQVALMIKNPPANTGDTRDAGSMPG